MSGNTPPPEDAYDTLARLYENPDQRVDALQALTPADLDLAGQADLFTVLGNEDRLRILGALTESECCGCELQVVLDAPQSTVATHLRKLKDAGLVKSREKGKWSYYRVADTAVLELLDVAQAIEEDR